MRQNLTLTISALVTVLLTTFHFTHDVLHDADGLTAGEVSILLAILLVLLYGTVELAGRRAGYIIMLLGGFAAAYMPYLHGMGPGTTRWGFFFVWTLLVMGVSGTFTAILSARALWRSFRQARSAVVTPR
jgi:hypothetical protein